MARRTGRAPPIASVTWRDGVHLTGTPIWCDARRRRDVCFVSSADRVGRTGHGQLIASGPTLALLGASGLGNLGVPLRQRFTLGTVRLELIPSGRGPGAAALFVDIAGRKLLYAGAVRAEGAAAAAAGALHVAAAEVRTCDAVVVSAPYGTTEHVFPPLGSTIAQTIEWTRDALSAGRRPVLVVDTALDGLEVAMCLDAASVAVAGSRGLRDLAQRAGGRLTVHLPNKEPRAIVTDRANLSRVTAKLAGVTTAVVSGAALAGPGDHDAAFAWAHAAGRAELLAWIESASAREVYVTGACAEPIAQAVGSRARVIGPPHQMTLFEALP